MEPVEPLFWFFKNIWQFFIHLFNMQLLFVKHIFNWTHILHSIYILYISIFYILFFYKFYIFVLSQNVWQFSHSQLGGAAGQITKGDGGVALLARMQVSTAQGVPY